MACASRVWNLNSTRRFLERYSTLVFANCYISATCELNDRKMMMLDKCQTLGEQVIKNYLLIDIFGMLIGRYAICRYHHKLKGMCPCVLLTV